MEHYDVFLNHRGPDVKGGFIAHLDEALRSAGLNPFLDKNSLVVGNRAFTSIDEALQVAKVHVAVVSKGYAESKYCLSELVAMVRSRKPVIPVFYDVEPAHLRRVENGPFAEAFQKHKSRERAEQVEEWADALGRLADITGFCFRSSDYKRDEAELKRNVVVAVMSLISTNEALQVERHRVGLEEPMNTCVHELEKMHGTTSILGLVGPGGIGKTSLAKEIYNHLVCLKKFWFMSFLEIDRSSSPNMEVGSSISRLQKQLLRDLLSIPDNTQQSYKYWFQKLSSRGPVLIVLDDIHDKSRFDNLILDTKLLAPGSCIIVTSHDRHPLNLLKVVVGETNFYLHEVTTLRCDDSEKLFNCHAFGDEKAPKDFEALAHQVSKACGGLPLALEVVGSSLWNKRSDEDRECIWPKAIVALEGDVNVVSGDLGRILKELWWLRSRYMPATQIDLSNLTSLDFSKSTMLAHLWAKSSPSLEACPNLLRLNLEGCTSITELPDSIGHLSRLQMLDLTDCENLQKLPSSIGQLTTLEVLRLDMCTSLDALPDSLTALSGLRELYMNGCSSILKLPIAMGHLSGLRLLSIDLATEWQAVGIRHSQFNALKDLGVTGMTDDIITKLLDSSDTLRNPVHRLSTFCFYSCPFTKLPETIGLLTNLDLLLLQSCEKLQELPNSIGQLKMLETLQLQECSSLDTLPDSLGGLTSLRILIIEECTSITKLPESIRQLNSLEFLKVSGCGSLEGLSASTVLQGLRIWGCTSIRELPGSSLIVMDINGPSQNWSLCRDEKEKLQNCKELRSLEENDYGSLHILQDTGIQGQLILRRFHKLSCCKLTVK